MLLDFIRPLFSFRSEGPGSLFPASSTSSLIFLPISSHALQSGSLHSGVRTGNGCTSILRTQGACIGLLGRTPCANKGCTSKRMHRAGACSPVPCSSCTALGLWVFSHIFSPRCGGWRRGMIKTFTQNRQMSKCFRLSSA